MSLNVLNNLFSIENDILANMGLFQVSTVYIFLIKIKQQ